ncbi:AAA family ATPase [Arthrobacter rhombi]|uniref:AAA family ATPase n=1 Tax=Arthrobacter rhombi TaxID=71253 RepID=UPI003FD1B8D2
MILEHAVLPVRPGREAEFEQAFATARSIIAASPGFRNLHLSRGIENSGAYLLLAEWDSLEGHIEGFCGSEAYALWKALLHQFCETFPNVEHFSPVSHRTAGRATVHLICGLNGAGKTTLARRLERSLPAARFTLDAWMIGLYPELDIDSPAYGPRAETCKQLIWDSALGTLWAGTDVVLDWNQWSRARRAEWSTTARAAGFNVLLHHVKAPLELAIGRAERRGAEGTHDAHVVTADGIRHMARLFEEPEPAEGLPLTIHEA